MNIFHSPRANCVGESLFVCFLRKHFPNANYVEESYPIQVEYLENSVSAQSLIAALEQDHYLPNAAKETCLEILTNNCPPNIKIALNPNRISFDVVITLDKETFYWEFHEKQHRNLADPRNKQIYNAENDEVIIVPRYLQRLIRDVWRFQNFRPYTIVWQDWFVANCYTYKPQLQAGVHEFYLPDEFSFSEFI